VTSLLQIRKQGAGLGSDRRPAGDKERIAMRQDIDYRQNVSLETDDIIRVLVSSGIRRPTSDHDRIERMFANAGLVISAWRGDRLVGVARSITDFSYCCYLSDLAVERDLQRLGIGRELIRRTQSAIGDEVSLMLLAAPEAMSYYPGLGFSPIDNGFKIARKR
jgi:GNAT superfamily N-acetyltransferase